MELSDDHIELSMTCPCCRARQEWSDECRRCKSDLRLLRGLIEIRKRHRLQALRFIASHNYDQALEQAEQADRLYSAPDTLRLRASCYLLLGDFERATRWL